MRITATNDASLILRVNGWQFPNATNDSDAEWLMISGKISLGRRSWSFTDPCMTFNEAQALASWLRSAAAGDVQPRQLPAGPDDDWAPDLWFIEPVLAFSLGSGAPGLALRVNASLEAAPPWSVSDERLPWGYAIDLQVSAPELGRAASQWSDDLAKLPSRSRPPRRSQAGR
jgi:hypothetical protein